MTQQIADAARTYTMQGSIVNLWKCRDNEVLAAGPAGTGKTRGILEKVHYAAMKHPGMRGLLVRKTRVSMTESVLVTFEKKVLPENSPLTLGAGRDNRKSYRYPNGSELILGGLDKVERFMSTDYDMICVFEATETTEDDIESLATRLRNNVMPYQQILLDCNPAGPLHWLKKRSDTKQMTRFDSDHKDNPILWNKKTEKWTKEGKRYRGVLDSLSSHRRDRLFLGAWASAEGLVYDRFDSCFLDQPMEKIPFGLCYGGIDFGFSDPFVALGAVQFAPDGYDDVYKAIVDQQDVIYIYYERYKSRTSMRLHAAAMRRVFSRNAGMWHADPSRPDSIDDLRRGGIKVRGARNDILVGIEAVDARIESGRLLISPECSALRAEAQSYRYPSNKAGEKPEPGIDHAMDALRYMIISIDERFLAVRPEVDDEPEEDYEDDDVQQGVESGYYRSE